MKKLNNGCGSQGGIKKLLIYTKIALDVLWRYKKHISPSFLRNAYLLLHAFWDNKLIKLSNGTYKLHLYLPAYPTRAFFKSVEDKIICKPALPITVVYSITKACTFRCPHCYQRKDKGTEIPLDLMLKTIKGLSDCGVTFLNIEGGDAFLRFNELVTILDNLDDSMEVWVNTTGANVTKEKLQLLKDKGMCGLMVSIHNPDPEIHNNFVGVQGAYDMAVNTLRWCDEIGLGSAINAVMEKDKIESGAFVKIMELAKELNTNFVQLIHPKRAGLWLNKKELEENDNLTIKYILNMHKYYNNSSRKGLPALSAQVEEEQSSKFGCTAGGIDRFYVGTSGEVQPCEFLNISFGNVKEEDFSVIFNRMRSYFKHPCEKWLCTTKAKDIYDIIQKHNLTTTPIPYEYTKELVEKWDRGEITSLYKKMGIYE